MNKRSIIFVSVGAILALAALGIFLEPTQTVLGYLRGDTFHQDRSAGYWRKVLRSDDTSSLQSVEMVPFLIETLGSRNPILRGRAAIVLGEIGPPAKEAVPALLKACTDSNGKIDKMTLRYWELIEGMKKDGKGEASDTTVVFDTKNVEFQTEEDKASFAAAEALQKIDPAAARRAGLP
jgi:HEAT repeat protein